MRLTVVEAVDDRARYGRRKLGWIRKEKREQKDKDKDEKILGEGIGSNKSVVSD
jgi:hypothetical protein